MKVAVGRSEDAASEEAVNEILRQCLEKIGGLVPRGGTLGSAIDHEHQVLVDQIKKRYPSLELVGCTTNGEISSIVSFAVSHIS
jgi:hypothetical protein